MEVEGTTTMQELKLSLQEKEGIDAKQIRLVFKGKKMDDSQSMEAAGVAGGNTVHMVLALRGGF